MVPAPQRSVECQTDGAPLRIIQVGAKLGDVRVRAIAAAVGRMRRGHVRSRRVVHGQGRLQVHEQGIPVREAVKICGV